MLRAVIIMFIAMSLIPAGDSAGKILTASFDASPVYVAWSRFAVGAAILLPFVARNTLALLQDWRIWGRASMLAGGITCIQTALQTVDIATVFAAFFVGPLVSYALAVVFLREAITPLRTMLILVGFGGVVLVVRPGFGGEPGVLWAVAAGVFYGTFLTMSRWLSDSGTPLGLTLTQLLISALILMPWGLSQVPPLTGPVAGLTLLSAVFSMSGNLLLLYAYRLAPATRLAPLVYFQLIAAVLLGWLVFDALPDGFTWVGLMLIVGAGLVSARLR